MTLVCVKINVQMILIVIRMVLRENSFSHWSILSRNWGKMINYVKKLKFVTPACDYVVTMAASKVVDTQ